MQPGSSRSVLALLVVLLMVVAPLVGGLLVLRFPQLRLAGAQRAPADDPPTLTAWPSPVPASPASEAPPDTLTPPVAGGVMPFVEPTAPLPTETATLDLLPTAEPEPEPVGFRYVFPVRGNCAPYEPYHHTYPATDIFCDPGSEFLAPTSGIIDFVNRIDRWDPTTDVPADRGGIMVAMIGDDGVRYYGSHLMGIADGIEVGVRVEVGQLLGWTGSSGNAASTPPHLHFGISRPTTPDDWQTRRGEVPPYDYLRAWERGEMLTPVLPDAPAAAPVIEPTAVPVAAPANMPAELDQLFNQTAGTFGVVLADASSGTQQYQRNAGVVFPAASLIKLPIAVTVYQWAAQGRLSLDSMLTMDAEVIVGGTGSIQYTAPGSRYTVRELVARMLYDSDNTATNMLIDHLGGFDPVNQLLQQIGTTQTVLQRRMMDFEARAAGYDNLTTASDMTLLLQRLYAGTMPDPAGAQEIIAALTRTGDRQKIPAGVPPDVVVAHKTGVLPQIEHDAGIVLAPGQPYILVVLSQDLASNAVGVSTIAEASRMVYRGWLER